MEETNAAVEMYNHGGCRLDFTGIDVVLVSALFLIGFCSVFLFLVNNIVLPKFHLFDQDMHDCLLFSKVLSLNTLKFHFGILSYM